MNKFIASSLIGYTYGALTPLPANTFPLFGTTAEPSGNDVASNNVVDTYVKDGSVIKGSYRAIRNDVYTFPTQTLGTITTGADQSLATAAAANTRAFWGLTAASMGTWHAAANKTQGSGGATGASWIVCLANGIGTLADLYTKCNGGRMGPKIAGTGTPPPYIDSTAPIAKRLVFKLGTTTLLNVAGNVAHLWTWNSDVLLASLPQVSYGSTAVTDGTSWCSAFKNSLPNAGTKVTIKAANGLSGKAKCTWQLASESGITGPSIAVTKADYVNVLFQWVEFITTAALGTNGVLPASDGANYYIGAYPATGGVFINPITSQESDTTWTAWTPTVNRRITDPSVDVPGSIGKATYFTGSPGVFSDTTLTKTDSTLLIGAVNNKVNENNQFNSKVNTYNTAKDAYNKAVTEENARLKDIFKAAFDPKVVIPTRPDPPSPPAAYQGPFLAVKNQMGATATAWQTTYATQKMGAYLKTGTGVTANDFASAAAFHTRAGYLALANATTAPATATTLSSSGHIFGRLGQGMSTISGVQAPFYYGNAIAGNTPTLMLSVFPETPADTGLDAAAKFIEIDGKATTWQNADGWVAPGQPSKPASPMDPPAGAAYLSVGLAASLVVASLF